MDCRANDLEQAGRLRAEFLSAMSYELRTPLTSIIGFTRLLEHGLAGPVNEDQKRYLGIVYHSANRVLALINDLVELSRIVAGQAGLACERFNFAQTVGEVVQTLAPMAFQKSLGLDTDLPGPVLEITGDRKRCYQVLLNLAANAVRFTERGEVKITVRTEGELLRASVADTGKGIPREEMETLFEPFHDMSGPAGLFDHGVSLGLHVSRRLARLMGGDLTVESEIGKGSTFTFSVPLNLSAVYGSSSSSGKTA
jgi:signal transduction histidine kinase